MILTRPDLGGLADAAQLAGVPYRASTGHSSRDLYGPRRPDWCLLTRHLHRPNAVIGYGTVDARTRWTDAADTYGLVLVEPDPTESSDHLPIALDVRMPPTNPSPPRPSP